MSSFGHVLLKDVWTMLVACAPGHQVKATTHHYRVDYQNKTYHRLPRGAHGDRNPEVEAFHVRKMIRHLGIDVNCSSQHVNVA